MGKGRIAFVSPRYGDDVVGGAETVLRQAAERLAQRGWEVEILTTCARDHYTWANAYPAGTSRDGDLAVRDTRFVTGEGVLVPDSYDPDGFRAKYGITKPYVLFAGRREGGKGWSDLLRAFTRAVVRLGVDLELVSFGVGEVILPAEIAS